MPNKVDTSRVSKGADVTNRAVELYAKSGKLRETARELDIHQEQLARILKSPEGSYQLERTLREQARTRLVRLSGLVDKAVDALEDALENGNETLTRNGDIVRVKPGARDLTYILAWAHNSTQIWSDLLAVNREAIDVSISPEEAARNVERLEAILAQERKRLAAPPTQDPAQDSAPPEPPPEDERADWLS